MGRYHYVGFGPLPGAPPRYLATSLPAKHQLLAVLGFGACAWTVAPRDRFIGWTPQQRQARLHLVVNNARFLILPCDRISDSNSGGVGIVWRRRQKSYSSPSSHQYAYAATAPDPPSDKTLTE